MMRRILPAVLGLAILAVFVWTLVFLYEKSRSKSAVYKTEEPFVTDIVKKTVATGSIVPRTEIVIKPRVSGVVEKLMVNPGDYVEESAEVARIRIIPDMVTLNDAEAAVKAARISYENAKRELNRHRSLFAQQVIAETDLEKYRLQYELRGQELDSAISNLQLVREGAARKSGKVSNIVSSTVEGMVLDVPVKEGQSVIESNTFNEGTTIASVADMNDLIFLGKVDESEVGKIEPGMDLDITIGALPDKRFTGKLEYIAPKGVMQEGAIQFEIRAAIARTPDAFIRAGYSANASIVLDSRKDVLAVSESVLQFDDDKVFVEVEVESQRFEKRYIEVGLSDGIHIEVLSGLKKGEHIKRHQG